MSSVNNVSSKDPHVASPTSNIPSENANDAAISAAATSAIASGVANAADLVRSTATRRMNHPQNGNTPRPVIHVVSYRANDRKIHTLADLTPREESRVGNARRVASTAQASRSQTVTFTIHRWDECGTRYVTLEQNGDTLSFNYTNTQYYERTASGAISRVPIARTWKNVPLQQEQNEGLNNPAYSVRARIRDVIRYNAKVKRNLMTNEPEVIRLVHYKYARFCPGPASLEELQNSQIEAFILASLPQDTYTDNFLETVQVKKVYNYSSEGRGFCADGVMITMKRSCWTVGFKAFCAFFDSLFGNPERIGDRYIGYINQNAILDCVLQGHEVDPDEALAAYSKAFDRCYAMEIFVSNNREYGDLEFKSAVRQAAINGLGVQLAARRVFGPQRQVEEQKEDIGLI